MKQVIAASLLSFSLALIGTTSTASASDARHVFGTFSGGTTIGLVKSRGHIKATKKHKFIKHRRSTFKRNRVSHIKLPDNYAVNPWTLRAAGRGDLDTPRIYKRSKLFGG